MLEPPVVASREASSTAGSALYLVPVPTHRSHSCCIQGLAQPRIEPSGEGIDLSECTQPSNWRSGCRVERSFADQRVAGERWRSRRDTSGSQIRSKYWSQGGAKRV